MATYFFFGGDGGGQVAWNLNCTSAVGALPLLWVLLLQRPRAMKELRVSCPLLELHGSLPVAGLEEGPGSGSGAASVLRLRGYRLSRTVDSAGTERTAVHFEHGSVIDVAEREGEKELLRSGAGPGDGQIQFNYVFSPTQRTKEVSLWS